jgi:dUTP pyrophosphatase
MMLGYARTHTNAKTPTRGNPSDAGIDVYFCPEDTTEVKLIQPGECSLLRTGIKLEIPHGYMVEVKNRSSIASKQNLLVGACVIDSGYSGEILINLHNVGKETRHIGHGDKIAQLVVIPVVHARLTEISEEMLYDEPITISNRKEGGFGSTDKKNESQGKTSV